MEYPSRCDVERSLKTVFACCPRPARQAYTVDPTLIFDAGPASASDFHVRYADFASVPDGSVRRRVRRRISGVSDASFAPDVSLYAADGASGRPFPAVPTPVPTAALDHDAWLRPDAAAGRDSGVRPRVPGRIGRGHVDAGAPYTAPEPDCREQSILFDQCVDSVAVLNFAYAQCKSQGLGLPPTRSTAELACGVARFHCCPLADDGGVSRLP